MFFHVFYKTKSIFWDQQLTRDEERDREREIHSDREIQYDARDFFFVVNLIIKI